MLFKSTELVSAFLLNTGRPCISNTSTFAWLAASIPFMNIVRPARCIEMLFDLASVLMTMGSLQLSVSHFTGGLRTESGYGVLTSEAGCALRRAMTLSYAGFGLYCLS